jgi:hypothetical protein
VIAAFIAFSCVLSYSFFGCYFQELGSDFHLMIMRPILLCNKEASGSNSTDNELQELDPNVPIVADSEGEMLTVGAEVPIVGQETDTTPSIEKNPENPIESPSDKGWLITSYNFHKDSGFLSINVQSFPFIHLDLGFIRVTINVLDLLSHLSKTSRKKLAKALTSKEFSSGDFQEGSSTSPALMPASPITAVEAGLGDNKDSGAINKMYLLLINSLGLPSGISHSRLKWSLKAVTPEFKSIISAKCNSYKNKPKNAEVDIKSSRKIKSP